MNGKLIVIEGTDAVGKRTQTGMLRNRLRKGGRKVEIINFPTYSSIFGRLIKGYLHGKFGSRDGLPPELVSMLYALDRYQYAKKISKKLSAGTFIICNRYSQSNIYQAAKIRDGRKRREFIKWVWALESRLPRADAVVFLNLPFEISEKLLIKRGRKIDLHERDAAYQEDVRKAYLEEARRLNWTVIDCFDGNRVKEKEEIAKDIFVALGRRAAF